MIEKKDEKRNEENMEQMTRYISLLRGINVGGQKKVPMNELKALYVGLGFGNVVSYVQSGNVVFDSMEMDTAMLATMTEEKILQTFGFTVTVFIREADDLYRILNSNPFLVQRNETPGHLYVTFLYESPSKTQWEELTLPKGSGDEFICGSKEVFLFCPDGYGRTKLSNDFFERRLHMPATTRNWNTVQALYGLAEF
jgi:uncharacterized protein (DUF1697 family)